MGKTRAERFCLRETARIVLIDDLNGARRRASAAAEPPSRAKTLGRVAAVAVAPLFVHGLLLVFGVVDFGWSLGWVTFVCLLNFEIIRGAGAIWEAFSRLDGDITDLLANDDNVRDFSALIARLLSRPPQYVALALGLVAGPSALALVHRAIDPVVPIEITSYFAITMSGVLAASGLYGSLTVPIAMRRLAKLDGLSLPLVPSLSPALQGLSAVLARTSLYIGLGIAGFATPLLYASFERPNQLGPRATGLIATSIGILSILLVSVASEHWVSKTGERRRVDRLRELSASIEQKTTQRVSGEVAELIEVYRVVETVQNSSLRRRYEYIAALTIALAPAILPLLVKVPK